LELLLPAALLDENITDYATRQCQCLHSISD
jgi:hypothetical protein